MEGSAALHHWIVAHHLLKQGKGALPLKKKTKEAQGDTTRILLLQRSMLTCLITVEEAQEEAEAGAGAQWRMHLKKRVGVIIKGGAILLLKKKMGGVAAVPAQQLARGEVMATLVMTMRIEIRQIEIEK